LVSPCYADGNPDATLEPGNNTPFTISIEPPGNHVAGEYFTIRGTTTLPLNDGIRIEMDSTSFTQANPGGPEFEFAKPVHENGSATIISDAKGNHVWSFEINTSSLKPDEYLIKVYSPRYGDGVHTAIAVFRVMPGGGTMSGQIMTTTTQAPPSQQTTNGNPSAVSSSPTTAQRSPLPVTIAIASLGIIAVAAGYFRRE